MRIVVKDSLVCANDIGPGITNKQPLALQIESHTTRLDKLASIRYLYMLLELSFLADAHHLEETPKNHTVLPLERIRCETSCRTSGTYSLRHITQAACSSSTHIRLRQAVCNQKHIDFAGYYKTPRL